MSLSAMTVGAELVPSSHHSGRSDSGSGLYRAIALVTVFAMLFGGLLLMTPMEASAASAVTTARVNLRSGPGLQHNVVTVIPQGASVSVDGDPQTGFYPVTYSGTSGFVAVDFIRLGANSPDTGTGTQTGAVGVGSSVTGTATVTASLNLRLGPGTGYAVATVLPTGAAVELRGAAQGDFYPVAYNGTTGWAHRNWLTIGGTSAPAPTPSPGGDSGSVGVGNTVTGTGTVTANLNLRSGPGTGYSVVRVLQSGTTVELRGAVQGEFYPVAHSGTTGWAHRNWISVGTTSNPEPTPAPTPNPGSGSVPVGTTVTGTGTITANLNLRSGPDTGYTIVTVLRSGTTVELRGAAQGEFHPVAAGSATGWVHGSWLRVGSASNPAPTPTPDPASGGSVPVGDTSTGRATTTAALNLRQGPGASYAVQRVIPSTATVDLRGSAQNGYYPLVFDGTAGWAHGDWLTIGGSGSTPTPSPGDGSTPSYLYTTVAQNLRAQPSTSSASVWMIPPGTRVTITGAAQNGWYPAKWAHVSGWMYGEYLVSSYQPPIASGKEEIVAIIYAAADRYGQPREDMLRVAQCESHLDPNVVNPLSGTSGLFQFRPGTWATTPFANQNIFDPVANANAAGWMWSVGRRNEWACQ